MLNGILFSIFRWSMKHLWLPFIWTLVILALCAMPGKDIPHVSWLEMLAFDKWVHAGIFFILAVLMMRGLRRTFTAWPARATLFFTLIFSIGYGAALELMQGTYFEGREADMYDFFANSIGAICGVLLYRKLAARMKFFA